MHLIYQFIKFGIVGLTAAICHMLTIIVSVEKFLFSPLIANILAFFIAFSISLIGHKKWTFSQHTISQALTIKFFLVALLALLLSELIIYVFYNIWHYHYILATCIALIMVPPITFTLSKLWVFKH